MIGAACNSCILLANLHAVVNFVHANNCSFYIIDFFLKLRVTVVQNELRPKEKNVLKSLKKLSFCSCSYTFQRVTDYLLQHHQKLFEHL
jgi:hypothetical protein